MPKRCNRALRCSAWLGDAPRPRGANDDALKLRGVLMTKDSEGPAMKLKPSERPTHCTATARLGTKLLVSYNGVTRCRLTTQAQRPGARDATIATTTPPPGSLQRMVRPRCHGETCRD